MRRSHLLLPAFFCLLFTACKEGWTDDAKREYRSQCITEARGMYTSDQRTEAYCQCDLEVVTKHFASRDDVNEHRYKDAADSARIQKELEDCSLKARR